MKTQISRHFGFRFPRTGLRFVVSLYMYKGKEFCSRVGMLFIYFVAILNASKPFTVHCVVSAA